MPDAVRERIVAACDGEAVQLYALSDLNPQHEIAEQWVALTASKLAVTDGEDTNVVERAKIEEVKETPALSGNVLTVVGRADDPALAVLRYTHRQKDAMGNVAFILKQQAEGVAIPIEGDPDEPYIAGLTRPIKKAQATVSENKLTVVWRLCS